MKIILAPDSMKGSISSRDAAEALARGIRSGRPDAQCVCVPIADGGEGTLDALTSPAERRTVIVRGPDGRPVEAAYGVRGGLAVIEMARAAGLTLVPEDRRDVLHASTFGVGELMLHAAHTGCRDILLTVGGSGTNDGGAGLFRALGGVLLDRDGRELSGDAASLCDAAAVCADRLDPAVLSCRVTAASDVTNRLLGASGATAVFGPQKGVTPALMPRIEAGMTRWADCLLRASGVDAAHLPGSGAGGGVLMPLLSFCRTTVRSGIRAVLDHAGFDRLLEGADLCVTGEGRIDGQSLSGKAVSGVAEKCRAHGVPLEAVAGCVGDGWEDVAGIGVRRVRTLVGLVPDSVPDAERGRWSMAHAGLLLEEAGRALADSLPV